MLANDRETLKLFKYLPRAITLQLTDLMTMVTDLTAIFVKEHEG